MNPNSQQLQDIQNQINAHQQEYQDNTLASGASGMQAAGPYLGSLNAQYRNGGEMEEVKQELREIKQILAELLKEKRAMQKLKQ